MIAKSAQNSAYYDPIPFPSKSQMRNLRKQSGRAVAIWTEIFQHMTVLLQDKANVKAGRSAKENNELREKVGHRLKDRFGFTETTLEINEGDNS